MKKTITIEPKVQTVLNTVPGIGNQLYNDIEIIKGLDANEKEVTGKTSAGFNFRKLFNSIVIF
jgi:hypothetical protein